MTEGHEKRLADEVEGLLSLARRDLLLLAVATQLEAMDRVAVIAARLRNTLSYAQQLASQSSFCLRYFLPRLSELEDATRTWLPKDLSKRLEDADGKLVIADLLRTQKQVDKVVADSTVLTGFDWDGLALMLMSVQHATLSYISARRALLDSLNATSAQIHHACLNEARLRSSKFAMAKLEDCTLHHANLESSVWREAQIYRCELNHALLGNADLGNARFVDCDLRHSDIQGFPDQLNYGLAFVRCDLRWTCWHGRSLRGVSFIDCRMHGVYGAVAALNSAVIERADMSPEGDQSVIAEKAEAVLHWHQDVHAVMPSHTGTSNRS